jgi:hypothetical protein
MGNALPSIEASLRETWIISGRGGPSVGRSSAIPSAQRRAWRYRTDWGSGLWSVRCTCTCTCTSHFRSPVRPHVCVGESNSHKANQHFRADIHAVREQWQGTGDKAIKGGIEDGLNSKFSERGLEFVRRDERTGLFYLLTDREVRVKIRQCLREKSRDPAGFTPRPNQLPIQDQPRACDFWLGRGGRINKNPGNVKFRSIVRRCKNEYKGASDAGKLIIVAQLIGAMVKNGRRFLVRWKTDGSWYEADYEYVKGAVQRCFGRPPPDCVANINRSSGDDEQLLARGGIEVSAGSSVPFSLLVVLSNGQVVASDEAVAELERLLHRTMVVEANLDVDAGEAADLKPPPSSEHKAQCPESGARSDEIDGGHLASGSTPQRRGQRELVSWPP